MASEFDKHYHTCPTCLEVWRHLDCFGQNVIFGTNGEICPACSGRDTEWEYADEFKQFVSETRKKAGV